MNAVGVSAETEPHTSLERRSPRHGQRAVAGRRCARCGVAVAAAAASIAIGHAGFNSCWRVAFDNDNNINRIDNIVAARVGCPCCCSCDRCGLP
jgi:hypothetical protein